LVKTGNSIAELIFRFINKKGVFMQINPHKSSQPTAHKNSGPQSRLLKIKRKFKVPVSQLFNAFKTPEALKAWWWPRGFHAEHIDLDFCKGGSYFIDMKGYARGGGGMTGQFEEIIENKRIALTDSFTDKN
jgi:uncharacterized protein YndB with AHSA1/START domain